MTNDQFKQLLETLQAPQPQAAAAPDAAQIQQIAEAMRPQQHKSAAALGPMRSLDMGPDKMRKLKKILRVAGRSRE